MSVYDESMHGYSEYVFTDNWTLMQFNETKIS